jgi:hypothetical protein
VSHRHLATSSFFVVVGGRGRGGWKKGERERGGEGKGKGIDGERKSESSFILLYDVT